MSLDSWDITNHLVSRYQRFDYTKNFCCTPNLSQSMLSWEADLFVCTKSGYGIEVEIKVSASDWGADKLKAKWKPSLRGGRKWGWAVIKNFYYAAPLKLATRWEEFGIPDFAGVLGVDDDPHHVGMLRTTQLREAKNISGHRKLSPEEMTNLARVTAVRLWDQRANLRAAIRDRDYWRAELGKARAEKEAVVG